MNLNEGYVPEHLFGQDHFSTLAYLETVMVDCGGFHVGTDARMRTCRRHFRVFGRECGRPIRNSPFCYPVVMAPEQGSKLHDGSVILGHDDWHCVQDLANAGYLLIGARNAPGETATPNDIMPGVWLHLSPRGYEVLHALRTSKAAGGKFVDFVAPQPSRAA